MPIYNEKVMEHFMNPAMSVRLKTPMVLVKWAIRYVAI